ncbi:hypothetical protein ACFVDM_38235, partial [Streptomyces sp. NPDC057682]
AKLLQAGELIGFHYASRNQDPAELLTCDVTLHPRGLVIAMLVGKTKHSVCNAKIRYADEAEICPVRAYIAYRTRLVAEHGEQWADPSTPAFVGIDQWGHVTGGMVPDSVTRAIRRISTRAGVPIAWTGHSLRIGLASVGRKKGKDGQRVLSAASRPGLEAPSPVSDDTSPGSAGWPSLGRHRTELTHQ